MNVGVRTEVCPMDACHIFFFGKQILDSFNKGKKILTYTFRLTSQCLSSSSRLNLRSRIIIYRERVALKRKSN